MSRAKMADRLKELDLATRRAVISYPEDFVTRNGFEDNSDVRNDKRSKDEQVASGYDSPRSVKCVRYESLEPRKVYDGWAPDADGYIQDIDFLMDDAKWIGAKSLDELGRPSESGTSGNVCWSWVAKKSCLGDRDGMIEVRWDARTGFYDVELKCFSSFLVYGHNYVVHGFEYECEVMFFLNELHKHLRELKKIRDGRKDAR